MNRVFFSFVVVGVGLILGCAFRSLGEEGIAALWAFAALSCLALFDPISLGLMGEEPIGLTSFVAGGLGTVFAIAGFILPYTNGSEMPWFTAYFLVIFVLNGALFLYNPRSIGSNLRILRQG